MSFFFYENSVRRLLTVINSRLDTVTHQQNGEAGTADNTTAQNQVIEARSRYIESMRKAADAVSRECERLEFWSDVRQTTGKGHGAAVSAPASPDHKEPLKEDLDESTVSTRDSHSSIKAKDGAGERHEHDAQRDTAVEASQESPAEGPAEDEDEPAVAV